MLKRMRKPVGDRFFMGMGNRKPFGDRFYIRADGKPVGDRFYIGKDGGRKVAWASCPMRLRFFLI